MLRSVSPLSCFFRSDCASREHLSDVLPFRDLDKQLYKSLQLVGVGVLFVFSFACFRVPCLPA